MSQSRLSVEILDKKAKAKLRQQKMMAQFLKAGETFFQKNKNDNEYIDVFIEHQSDLIQGGKDINGEDLSKINVEVLYSHWHLSQKDEASLSKKVINDYVIKIENKQNISPIIIQNMIEDEGLWFIRTLDGRHRLAASNQLRLDHVYVVVDKYLKIILSEKFPNLFMQSFTEVKLIPLQN